MGLVAAAFSLILVVACAAAGSQEEAMAGLLRLASKEPRMEMLSLLRFVDTPGLMHNWLWDDNLTSEELVRLQFQANQLTSSQQRDVLNMLSAVLYAEELLAGSPVTLQDMVKMNSLLLGVDSSHMRRGVNLLSQNGTRWLETEYLSKFNPAMASLALIKEQQHKMERANGAFNLAAWSIAALRDARPFEDGNARLAEVMNAVVLTSIIGLPYPQRVCNHLILKGELLYLGHEHNELVANAIHSVSKIASHQDEHTVRGHDGVWNFVRPFSLFDYFFTTWCFFFFVWALEDWILSPMLGFGSSQISSRLVLAILVYGCGILIYNTILKVYPSI